MYVSVLREAGEWEAGVREGGAAPGEELRIRLLMEVVIDCDHDTPYVLVTHGHPECSRLRALTLGGWSQEKQAVPRGLIQSVI